MTWFDIVTETRAIGGLAFLFAAYSLWMGQMKVDKLPGDYPGPVLAMELVRTGADIETIRKSANGEVGTFIQNSLRKDLGYIVVYVLLFSWLSVLFARQSTSWSSRLAWVSAAMAIAAGVMDLLENRGMFRALKALNPTDTLALSIRYPSLVKWSMLFGLCCLLGIVLVQTKTTLTIVGGVLFGLTGLSGLLWLVANHYTSKLNPRFGLVLLFFALSVIWVAVSCLFFPRVIVRSL
jgi:hypothetical protein